MKERWTRRRFLKTAGVAGAAVPMAGGLVVAACNDNSSAAPAKPIDFITPTPGAPKTVAATSSASSAGASAASTVTAHLSMDESHKAGVEQFLANQKTPLTKGIGNQPLAPRIENGVKVWDLTIDEIDWETIPGKIEKARGYNKTMPGPLLRATEGDRVKVNFKNNLTESSAVHWHGILVPNAMDGVPYVTQEPIKAGETMSYEFTLRNSGTHMYHSHHNSHDQVNRGLLGAFIVDPKDPAAYPKYDREYVLVLNDAALGFTVNGKGFPATQALTAKKGERVLVRWLNEGLMNHPMHLHGMPMQVFARDGWPIANPYLCDTLDVAPGNRYDTIIEAVDPGIWAFHCHILSHAESPEGFFGLVTVLAIE